MHELSIVEALIDQVEREVQQSGHTGRVLRLELSIGRLSGVCADSIRFAFDLLTPDTPLAGAEVHIDQPRAVCVCAACNARTEIDEITAQCPACGSPQIRFDGGQEMLLQSIDLEDERGEC